MPTAARLMAAICLAIVALVLSEQVKPLMPESTSFGRFTWLNMGLGLLAGWFVMGPRAGRGTVQGINNGLTGVFVLILWGLGVQATYEMFRLAMRNRYKDAFEALTAIFEIGAEYGLIMLTVPIGVTFLIGALISGLLTEYAEGKWR
ncbi:tellurium resistance protein [Sulfitobacter sp. SK012]|uniref:TrgA family protein n=1 Tax=Sulfitobacter sp. SK012 TaxID=1389005 RepID=UPI000E0A785A|nr:TrgA family protein [Sulfitobacter sp. SK012]AXI46454.1 tellurium resistance protein [Sulfitobacter sp. SK012]